MVNYQASPVEELCLLHEELKLAELAAAPLIDPEVVLGPQESMDGVAPLPVTV